MIITKVTGIGDPFVLADDGTYYLYATSAADGFKVWTSKDLINWEENGKCYKNSPWGEGCFWAPEAYKYKGKYYLLFTATWKKNHSRRIGLAVSDSPLGPFKDIKDGPLFDEGYSAIDATFLFDDDGKNYIYYVRECVENMVDGRNTSEIYGAEISADLTTLLSEPKLIVTPSGFEMRMNWEWPINEGPVVIKHNQKYYLNYSADGYTSRNYCVCCAESDNPLEGFIKYDDNPILKYKENEFSGPGHNSVFKGFDGNLYTSFHIHTDYEHPSGDRTVCFARVEFDDTGKMKIVL
ncbi:MAG: family 43 glycosylhydrolase [Clostridia bacterium]|nr:family 43 glycosylhydrolase [Clostridia bacterium]